MIEHLGLVVMAYRKNKKLSQRDLAEKAGVHHNTVSHIERGFRGVAIGKVEAVLRVLGLRLAVLNGAVRIGEPPNIQITPASEAPPPELVV